MKNIHPKNVIINFPFTSKTIYKNQFPFIRIVIDDYVYLGYECKQLLLIDINKKHIINIFNNYQKPNDTHINILKQTTSKLKGANYQLIYVSNNQYLCLVIHDSIYTSLVLLTIDLNSKGYFEIQGIIDILKEK